jgi:ATP-dependent metalloprotease
MGAERKSHYVTEESKKMTAYHEGGHALVALHTKGAMPLHKVTIMPRGQALGITFQLPEQDKGVSRQARLQRAANVRLVYAT